MIRAFLITGVLVLLGIPALAATPAFHFDTRHDLTDPSSATTAVISADFNGDGIADLASAGSAGISIFLGVGQGHFAPPATISILQGSNPFPELAVADVNSDGIPDLLVFDGYNIGRTLLGKGDGTFDVGPEFSEPATNASNQIFSADFNGDGKPDLALGSELGVNILLGHGDGTFGTAHLLPVTGNRCIAVGDFNSDDKADVAACGFNVEVFLGNGDGTFQKPVQSATPSQAVFLTTGDLNGDGKLDLAGVAIHDVGSNPNLGPVYVLYGNGDGSFGPATQIHSDTGSLYAVAIGAIGTTFPAIVALSTAGVVATILNKGSDVSELYSAGPVTFGATYNDTIILTDLNGDGKRDIATSNSGGSYFSVLFQVTDDRFTNNVTVPVSGALYYANFSDTNINQVARADFNNDGHEDVAFLGYQQGASVLSVYLGSGVGHDPFTKGPQTTLATGPSTLVAGDFNNDGIPDVAICYCGFGPGPLTIYLGNGDGTFATGSSVTVHEAEYMIVSDFNNDASADIALSGGTLLLGHGDGTFGPPTQFFAGTDVGLGDWLGAADFNHDGIMDIAFLPPEIADQPRLNILLGNGDGTFQTPMHYSVGGDPEWGDIADFNGDGVPDIAIWNSSAGGIKPQNAAAILLGNGDGTFASAKFVQGDNMQFPNMILARDLNGDGHVDLAVLSGGDYNGYLGGDTSIFVFPGNGDGTFGPQQQIPGGQGMSFLGSGYFGAGKSIGYPDLFTLDAASNLFAPVGTNTSAISVFLNRGTSK